MPTEAPPPELPGYTLVGRLGSGGSGEVFAYDQRLPARRVAVKVLREPVTGAAQAAAFVAEANAMAALEHPHIVPVHAAGVAADGRPYLVMAHYPGPDLEVRCRAAPLSPAEALRVGVQVGGAVEVAHRRGLLHRDIKPANILTGRFGVPGLADFGLAGSPGDGDGPEFGVSVPWAAPEVLFGTGPASVRSDVYSLAATVWTLLAGRSPFESAEAGDTTVRLLRRIRSQPAPPVGRADVPPEVDAALAAALAKDPADRPASALALVESLRDAERRLGLPATDPLVGDAPPGDPPPGPLEGAAGRPRPPRLAAVLAAPAPAVPAAPAPAAPAPEPAVRAVPVTSAAASTRPRPRRVGPVALIVLAVLAGWWLAAGGPRPDRPVVTITGSRVADRVVFAWTWAPQRPGDTFEVLVRDRVVPRAEPMIELAGDGRLCVRVRVLDAAGAPRGGLSDEGCAG